MEVSFDNQEKIKTCCFFRCTKRQRYVLFGVLLVPIVFLVCLIIGITIRAAVEKERFQRIVLDPNPSLIDSNQSVIWQRARTLGQAIKFNTISYNQTYQITEQIEKIHGFISDQYPYIHSAPFIEKHIVNNHSIVFRVNGTEPINRLYMLCAHLDVVPEGDLSKWDCDPFLGEIVRDHECVPIKDTIDDANAYIFGRGAIDDKHSVFGILEALEHIIKSGEQPRRSFYVAFGHDEEVSGNSGAGHIRDFLSEALERNGESLDFIVDEGNSVYQDVVPGVDIPVAMIGVTEKGKKVLS